MFGKGTVAVQLRLSPEGRATEENHMIAHRARRSMAVAAVLGVSAIAAASGAAATAGRSDTGTSYVAVTHQIGSTLYAAGNSSDNVLGNGSVTYKIKAGTGTKPGTIKITANRVTLFTATGSLYGSAAGVETTAPDNTVTLSGTLKLTHGTGAQKGHSFVGHFAGTGKTAVGPFVFHTKGTYR
jgi:hypothetical protein